MHTASATDRGLIATTPVLTNLTVTFLGRESKFAYIPVRRDKSEELRNDLRVLLFDLEREGFLFQRIPSGLPINEGYGLLKDILKDAGRTGELGIVLPTDKDESEAALVGLCGQYELWRFFSDFKIDDDVWQGRLSHLMAQIAAL